MLPPIGSKRISDMDLFGGAVAELAQARFEIAAADGTAPSGFLTRALPGSQLLAWLSGQLAATSIAMTIGEFEGLRDEERLEQDGRLGKTAIITGRSGPDVYVKILGPRSVAGADAYTLELTDPDGWVLEPVEYDSETDTVSTRSPGGWAGITGSIYDNADAAAALGLYQIKTFYDGQVATAVTIGLGSQSTVIGPLGLYYRAGDYIRIAGAAGYMDATVTSYNSGTGALVFNALYAVGSGGLGSGTTKVALLGAASAVTPGAYTLANVTVDATGRVTAASSTTALAISFITGLQAALDAKQAADVISALTWSSSITLDFNGDNVRTLAVTGNTTFNNTTNKAQGKTKEVYITCDSSARTLTFPASWKWVSAIPAGLVANKGGILTLKVVGGTAETDVWAAFAPMT